jgi:glycolate oxidase
MAGHHPNGVTFEDEPPMSQLQLSSSARNELRRIFADRFSADREDCVAASCDATKRSSTPAAVVWPLSTAEVAALVKLANAERFPVVARGAASGLTGGAVPAVGSVVADFTRMDRIIEIDRANLTALVEPGVVIGTLQKAAERLGLFYPPDPASDEYSTMGGNIAECAGGLRGLKYGVTRDYVLQLEAVTGAGDVIHTGSNTIKSVTGYDLTRLIVGSEGTLAIVMKARLKLIPLPEALATAVTYFPTPRAAGEAVSAIIEQRLLPRALEFIDGATMKVLTAAKGYKYPEGAGALLIIEMDGGAEQVRGDIARAVAVAREKGAILVEEAETPEARAAVWAMRKQISPALYKAAPDRVNEDIVVPRNRIPEMLDAIEEIGRKYNLPVCNYAHVGDGNIHVNFLIDGANHDEAERAEKAVEEMFAVVMDFGGTLSGEHGIGLSKKRFLALEVAPHEMRLMKEMKRVFDPNGILNPGKIFPE